MTDSESNKPRTNEDIKAAQTAIKQELIMNPIALLKSGMPAAIHYVVIIEALEELLTLRTLFEMMKNAKD